MRRVGLPDLGILAAGLVTTGAALSTTTPLLRTLSLGIDDRVFPVTADQDHFVFDLPAEGGGARLESTLPRGCLQVTPPSKSPTRICNPHVHCSENSLSPQPSTFEVFNAPGEGGYYVETGSSCNSACCDWRGAVFSGDGRRLDDGPFHRLYLRLGVLGAIALGVGVICLCRTLKRPERKAARVVSMAGFALAIASLWWNL